MFKILPITLIKKRARILFAVVVAFLLSLILKVGYWQIIRGDEMRAAVERQQTGATNVIADRGTIYDRNGKALAESATVNTLICNPQDVDKKKETHEEAEYIADKLSVILDMDYDRIFKLLTKENRYQVIKKRLTIEETEQVKLLKTPKDADGDGKTDQDDKSKLFKAITFEEDSKRYYSYNVAPGILGFTGYDNNGIQGVELSFDDYLSGANGSVVTAQSASGTTLEDQQYEAYTGALKGADVVLTIDETIQHYLEKYLENAVEDSELKEGAAGIVMNPKTGEILAMATKPDFDANEPYDVSRFEKYSIDFEYESDILDRHLTIEDQKKLFDVNKLKNTKINGDDDKDEIDTSLMTDEQIKELLEERTAAMRNKMWRNKAISDAYEPGSTFKIITAAAALEEGVVNMETPFVCNGSKKLGSYEIHCHVSSGHGPQNFLEGVKHSCNVVFMETGMRLGSNKFKEYFESFGLTRKTGIDLVGEAKGIFYSKEKLSDTDIATSSFGQGFNVTPIQLITAISAVINGGNLLKPQIVKEIRNNTGVIKSYQTEVVNKVISEETSAKMREALEQVVSAPDGTGKNAYISGYRIGGKTGTSQKGDRNDTKRIASFVGFAPADDPQIICLIMLDEPQVANKFGGTIAAPVAGAVIEDTLEYLGVDRKFEGNEQISKAIVADVRDMEVADAKEDLVNLGFKVKVSGKGSKVVDQLPKPGMQLAKNSIVILYTKENTEIDMVEVPSVKGETIANARNILASYNLNFETIGAGQSTTGGAFAVKQSVEPGTKVPPATVIGVQFRHSASD